MGNRACSPGTVGKRSAEQVGSLDDQARRIEAERAGGERTGYDRSVGGPRMMGHLARVRVDIEVMMNACELEITNELGARIHVSGRWRLDFDNNDRIGHLHLIWWQRIAAIHEGVGLVGGMFIDRNGQAVGKYLAFDAR